MGSTILTLLKELNGYKYIIAISIAVVGSWYDIKGELHELRTTASTLKEVVALRAFSQVERDTAQEAAVLRLHDDLLAEIRLLRQEMASKHK